MSNKHRGGQSSSEEESSFSGPNFEAGPGWGEQTSTWLKEHMLDRVLPAAVIVIVVIVLVSGGNNDSKDPEVVKATDDADEVVTADNNGTALTANVVSAVANAGEGYALVARRALAVYLSDNTDIELTRGQKIFIEDALSKTVEGIELNAGDTVEFKVTDVEKAVEDAQNLTPYQLKVWEGYAAGAVL